MKSAWRMVLRAFCGALGGPLTLGTALAALAGCCSLCPWARVNNPSAGNGIAVDQPKVFDNRSLVLKLEHLNARLSQLTTLDQAKLAQSIGVLQGMRASEVDRSFSISTLPLPGTQLTEQRDAASNQLLSQQRVTTNAAFSPSAPALAPGSLPAIAQSGYGIAAQDILSEQVNLAYQVLNLQMLLERSVTDRIRGNKPRAQAVLGFQVSLDPMKQHKNQAAIVEVELSSPARNNQPPSLVALMPQAKTYNVAALSKESNAFAASAVVKVVTLGYSERHAAESYFLYRDADTVAFERPARKNKLVFGWEFRPVLNRKAVEPGIRQLFAVVALDDLDDFAKAADFAVIIRVRTYWADFDKKKAVISSEPCEERAERKMSLSIPCSDNIQKSLGPQVEAVTVKPAGEASVLVDVLGNNFYNGTTALVGDKLLDSGSPALLIKDDHLLQIIASALDLANGNILIRGRYGLSAEVIDPSAKAGNPAMPDPFDLIVIFPAQPQKGHNPVTIELRPKSGRGSTAAPDLKGRLVILTIGQQGFVLEPASWRPTNGCLETHLEVKSEWVQERTPATAVIPFVPECKAQTMLYMPVAIENVVLLRDADPQVWGITGRGFDTNLIAQSQTVITADQDYTTNNGLARVGDHLLQFPVAKTNASKIKNLVVKLGYWPPVVLAAPKLAVTPLKVTVDASKPPTPAQDSAPVVVFEGENFGQVSKVSFGTKNLPYIVQEDGKKLRVFLDRDVTAKLGPVSLVVQAKDGTICAATVTVIK